MLYLFERKLVLFFRDLHLSTKVKISIYDGGNGNFSVSVNAIVILMLFICMRDLEVADTLII